MSRAAISIIVFGAYLIGLGAVLALMPNLVLGLLGFALASEVWIRVAGVLIVIIGYFFWVAARHETVSFFRASLVGRSFLFLSLIGFVLAGLAPPLLIAFGLVDVAGAAWTAWELRKG